MNHRKKIFIAPLILLMIVGLIAFTSFQKSFDNKIISYTVDPKKQNLQFYWKNDSGKIIGSIQNLKAFVENKNLTLIFAMNGGMFMQDLKPLGLYIQDGKKIKNINKASANGNFYIKPNGVFYITNNNDPFICKTNDFVQNNIKYATQSGPMLVIDGQVNSNFKAGSYNQTIRNGVGILSDNKVLFAISKTEINLYDFAKFFQELGCKNALYLDGFVSQMYLPEKKWTQTNENIGVIIGVTTNLKAGSR